MDAQRAELSWDADKNQWLARIIVGEEVIRRHINEAQSTDQHSLVASAVKTAADEGYTVSPSDVVFV